MKSGFLGTLRTFHGWLGVIVVPWVLIMGITGFYLNHSKFFRPIFEQQSFAENKFAAIRPPAPITEASARALAASIWPDQPIRTVREKEYHGWASLFVETDNGSVIVAIPTGHYYVKTRYSRQTFSPTGVLVDDKIYWKRIFKDLHKTGWLGGRMGTVLADIFSFVLIVFGVTGTMMWSIPKIRRLIRTSKKLTP